MKKLIFVVGVLLAVNILFAQERKEKVEARIEAYKERLNLSEDQITDLKEIREKYKPEMEAIRSDESKSKSDKMRASADVIEKRESEVMAILNTKQQEEWKAIQKEVSGKRAERREQRKARRVEKDGN